MRWSAVLALVVVLLAGATVLGGPVRLSYVYSDSMSPTLHVGDGYVLVPAGDVGPVTSSRSTARRSTRTSPIASSDAPTAAT